MISQVWAALILVSLAGCVSPNVSRLSSVDYPILTIQKGIKKALPVPFQNVSRDGRIFESHTFVRSGNKLVPAGAEAQRARAIIEIRGSERPYTVEVSVEIEEAQRPQSVQKDFRVVSYDDVVPKIFLARLKAYLQKSKKRGNVVDDFRLY